MRELVYYIATTLDGFIARPDGSFADFPWDDAFIATLRERFPETLPAPMRPAATRAENRRFDAVLMGRRTYEVGSQQGLTSPYPTLDQYVVSSTINDLDPAVTVVDGDPVGLARRLKAEDGLGVWICGGSALATPLFAAGLVDRLVIKVAPVVFGDGIPLFRGEVRRSLTLVDRTVFDSGYSLNEFLVDNDAA